jgi:hypothetical protein
MATKKSIKKKKSKPKYEDFGDLLKSLILEFEKASQDALVYGEGRLKANPDGTIEHIPRKRKN